MNTLGCTTPMHATGEVILSIQAASGSLNGTTIGTVVGNFVFTNDPPVTQSSADTLLALCNNCPGHVPTLCVRGCDGNLFSEASVDDCYQCSGGVSGHVANSDKDCNGTCFGGWEVNPVSSVCECVNNCEVFPPNVDESAMLSALQGYQIILTIIIGIYLVFEAVLFAVRGFRPRKNHFVDTHQPLSVPPPEADNPAFQ